MKRDMELIRKILLILEEHEHGYSSGHLKIEDYSDEQIGYHVWLMGDAGLLTIEDITHEAGPSPEAFPQSITWEGYEFLEAAKEPKRWQEALMKVKNAGAAMTIDVLKTTLIALSKDKLGI